MAAEDVVFIRFNNEQLEGTDWNENKPVYCVVDVPDSPLKIIENTPHGPHAEVQVIEWWKKNVKQLGKNTLTIYQNKAPCHDCAGELRTFAQDHGLQLTIKAVGTHYENEAELKQLMLTPGVTFGAFTEPDWQELRRLMKAESEWKYTEPMRQRDYKTAAKFAEILN